tara:strand:+ start:43 stop:240 length:198 start_codon:yes stop_codon:yes gene_type:complete
MDQIGKPIEINRKFLKFMEEEIQPEYKRVLQTLVQQIKEELDQLYNPQDIQADEKYLNKGSSDNT